MKTRILSCLMLLAPCWASAQDSHWQCDPHAFEYDMTVNLALSDGQASVDDYSDYELAAFSGNECRGVAEFISVGQTTYGYLRVRSNNASGDVVSFKVFKKSWNKELPVETLPFTFEALATKGQPSTPFNITFRSNYQITLLSDEKMGTVSGGGIWNYDTVATVAAEPAVGYHFERWSDGATENPYSFTVIRDSSFTAFFAPNQYTMTFVPANGEDSIRVTQDYATALTAPAAPTRTGFTFTGWTPVVPDSIPASDLTFTAQWERNSYKLSYVSDGQTVYETNVLYEDSIAVPASPSKVGYTFTDWTPAVAQTMPAADVTYTATFTINQYTMTFVPANGEDSIMVTQDYATALTAPAAPTRTGFTFTGWTPAVPDSIPASDLTFTAQWERNSYKLSYVSDGRTVYETNVLFEDSIAVPASPSKEGYTFASWSPALASIMPAEDVTYTATFTVNQYTMTFVPANGEDSIMVTQDYATALTAPSAPTRTGFTFAGWTPTVPDTIPASDKTFTAQWERNSYKLTYVSDGRTVYETNVLFEDSIAVPASPSKEGYTFAGWSPALASIMPAEDVTYTATFTVNQYTMTFVQANGEADIVFAQDYATALTVPSAPTRTGFTFAGWTPAVPDTIPASDKIFTAQWERNSYKLTYVSDGRTVYETNVLYEDSIAVPASPSKEGYTFAGWSPAVASIMPAEDVTYTATFTINQYTVTFMNGNEIVKVDTLDYGTTIVLPENPIKEGHTFVGWGDVPETVPATDVCYNAEYSVNTYTIRYYVGDSLVAEQRVQYGEEIVLIDYNPEGNFSFVEWAGETHDTMPAKDLEYHATITDGINTVNISMSHDIWTLDGHKVTVNNRGTLRPGLYIINGRKVLVR